MTPRRAQASVTRALGVTVGDARRSSGSAASSAWTCRSVDDADWIAGAGYAFAVALVRGCWSAGTGDIMHQPGLPGVADPAAHADRVPPCATRAALAPCCTGRSGWALAGNPFTLLKFRSMRVDAETRGPAWATQRDPRVTGVGAFLRRTRIDELPQLHQRAAGAAMRLHRPAARAPALRRAARGGHSRTIGSARGSSPASQGWAQVNFPYGASVEDAQRASCPMTFIT